MILIVMGVSGAGKSTLAKALADRLKWRFLDADALHSAANVAKMTEGVPLDDADRSGWLDAIAGELARWQMKGASGVVACSALKRAYRDRLRAAAPGCRFVYLKADLPLVVKRLTSRSEHFMPATLAKTQFDVLEPPAASEAAIPIPLGRSVEQAMAIVLEAIAEEIPRTTRR